jgi:hypothetical protein
MSTQNHRTTAAPGYNLRLIMTGIFTVGLEQMLVILRFLVLIIETGTLLLCAPIYYLIQFCESLISRIGSRQLTNPIQTTINAGR